MNACWATHCGCEAEGGPSCSVHAACEVKYDRAVSTKQGGGSKIKAKLQKRERGSKMMRRRNDNTL